MAEEIMVKPDDILPHAIVYGAMHASGKWYIGSTKSSLDCRRHEHYARAHRPTKSKFYDELVKTREDEWTWSVQEEFTDVTRRDLQLKESQHIEAFDSIATGYNTTLPAVSEDHKTATQNASSTSYYTRNRDVIHARAKEWRKANREKLNAKAKREYRKYGHVYKAKLKAKRAADKDGVNAAQRAYREKNRERINAAARARRAMNRDAINAANRAYRASNPNRDRETINAKARAAYAARRQRLLEAKDVA